MISGSLTLFILGAHTPSYKPALQAIPFIVQTPRMPDSSPSPRPTFTTHEEVMFFDTDCGGVVHNLAYLRMIETCRTKLAAQMGLDLRTMAKTQCYPVVVRTEIDYRRPARLGDLLRIEGKLGEVKRARFWCEFEMKLEQSEQLLISCRQSLALVQMPAGKPVRLPKEWNW